MNLFVSARTFDPTTDYFIPFITLGPIVYFEDYLGREEAEKWNLGPTPPIISRNVARASAKDNPGWFIYLANEDGRAYTLDRKSVGSALEEDDKELTLDSKMIKDLKTTWY